MTKNVWILADDRAGNVNQLLGIAESLGEPFDRKDIAYTRWVKLPNFIRDNTLIGLTEKSRNQFNTNTWPDIVLSAGRRSFPVARYIQKKSNFKTKIVQLMNPGKKGFNKADLVVLPTHDHYRGHAQNVLIVTGTPHRITAERIQQERTYWEPRFKHLPHPRLSLIVGGATKDKDFPLEQAEKLVEEVRRLKPASIMITTSRRTPANVIVYLKRELSGPTTFFYTFGSHEENPYFGLLTCADMIVVTGDSMSMCSECCATGVPVLIFAPAEMMSAKHQRFHASLFSDGYALPAGSELKPVKGNFNPTRVIVEQIQKL